MVFQNSSKPDRALKHEDVMYKANTDFFTSFFNILSCNFLFLLQLYESN